MSTPLAPSIAPSSPASASEASLDVSSNALQHTPLHALHLELGARMVPFAGYSMPVQYPSGLVAEHHHTRQAASLFDVSHMGQLRLAGPQAAAALERLIPMDVLGLPLGKQRYGLLLNAAGGILDDLMLIPREDGIFLVVNGACKAADLAHMQAHIGQDCEVVPLPEMALLALQGPQACAALARLAPGVERLTFMTGGHFVVQCGTQRVPVFLTRSGYSGEDGFEISVHAHAAEALARALLAQPEVRPAGLGARNSLRLEAGLCLHGNDIDSSTNPVEAQLVWALQKVRQTGGARAGGFMGAQPVLAALDALRNNTDAGGATQAERRQRVGLLGLERVPVREGCALHNAAGEPIGSVTSGLLSPVLDAPIAMGYVRAECSAVGTRLHAIVRGKAVPMQVVALPFVPHRYFRG